MVPQRGRQLSYRMAGFRLAITSGVAGEMTPTRVGQQTVPYVTLVLVETSVTYDAGRMGQCRVAVGQYKLALGDFVIDVGPRVGELNCIYSNSTG